MANLFSQRKYKAHSRYTIHNTPQIMQGEGMKAGSLHHAAASRLAQVYHLSYWKTRCLREDHSITSSWSSRWLCFWNSHWLSLRRSRCLPFWNQYLVPWLEAVPLVSVGPGPGLLLLDDSEAHGEKIKECLGRQTHTSEKVITVRFPCQTLTSSSTQDRLCGWNTFF
ncbi:hypothetical protein BJV78DRAFT_1264718 [Lactifluus subvellereus]|nr:hypothetical protein BJV78DRAFT_1264718 [Lactifluus subvellereus]